MPPSGRRARLAPAAALAAVLAVALAVLAGGCAAEEAVDGSAVTGGTPSQAASDPAPQAPADDATEPAEDDEVTLVELPDDRPSGFTTPSGNITCLLAPASDGGASDEARCEIREKSWEPPDEPDSCGGEWGGGLALSGAAEVLCATDTITGDAAAGTDGSLVLAYGLAVRLGTVTCTSRETGVRCEDARTGSGFALRRADYELF